MYMFLWRTIENYPLIITKYPHLFHTVIRPEDPEGMVNSVEPDQTAYSSDRNEPRHKTTCLWGLRPGKTQTGTASEAS